jgi:mRNA interferase MazF
MKNFKAWHYLKAKIESYLLPPRYHEREIWWCSLGENIGTEQDGKNDLFERPVLVLRKFNKEMFWALPMSSKEKTGPYNQCVIFHGKRVTMLMSQLRVLSSKRLIRRIGRISDSEVKLLGCSLASLLLIKNGPLAGSSGA